MDKNWRHCLYEGGGLPDVMMNPWLNGCLHIQEGLQFFQITPFNVVDRDRAGVK